MDRILMMSLSGILDALSPCALTTAGIFGILLFILRDSLSLIRAFGFSFLFFHFFTGFFILAGWGADYFSSVSFLVLVVYFYLIIGAVFIGIGLWLSRMRSKIARDQTKKYSPVIVVKEPALLRLLGALLGLGLAIPATCWPPHWWVINVANDMFLPGKLKDAFVGMAWYGIVKLWPMFLAVWVYRSFRRHGACADLLAKRLSLTLAVAAAFYTGLGLGLILLFVQKL